MKVTENNDLFRTLSKIYDEGLFVKVFNPNKDGLFEGSFFKKNLTNIDITLYNC